MLLVVSQEYTPALTVPNNSAEYTSTLKLTHYFVQLKIHLPKDVFCWSSNVYSEAICRILTKKACCLHMFK